MMPAFFISTHLGQLFPAAAFRYRAEGKDIRARLARCPCSMIKRVTADWSL